jgi:hypothetical protein
MSLADFDFLAGWAKSQGWTCLRLLGGEATWHPEFKTILDTAEKHGLTLYITTNGLFDPGFNSSLGKGFVRSICFSYPQDGLHPREMAVFRQNLEHAINRVKVVVMSWVIQPNNDRWRQLIDLAKNSRTRTMVRFSMVLPGHRKNFGTGEFLDQLRNLATQIINIAKYAQESHVVVAFYRPFLRCMFTQEQMDFLRSISPFLFYTRCPLCLGGEYDSDLRLTINPDLSCYPCPVLSAKGVKITPDTTRESINKLLAPRMREITAQPLMDSCHTCRFFANYKRHLGDKHQDLADLDMCQGGCFQYRV